MNVAQGSQQKLMIALIKKCLFTERKCLELQECCFHLQILSGPSSLIHSIPLFFFDSFFPQWGSPLMQGLEVGLLVSSGPPLLHSSASLVYIPLPLFGDLKPPFLSFSCVEFKHSHLSRERKLGQVFLSLDFCPLPLCRSHVCPHESALSFVFLTFVFNWDWDYFICLTDRDGKGKRFTCLHVCVCVFWGWEGRVETEKWRELRWGE